VEEKEEEEEDLTLFMKNHGTTSMLFYGGNCMCVVPQYPSVTTSIIFSSKPLWLK